jgi:hypothetical protein
MGSLCYKCRKLSKDLNQIKLSYCYNQVIVVRCLRWKWLWTVERRVVLLSVIIGVCVGCSCKSGCRLTSFYVDYAYANRT